ncbi:MAG: hypothetical protein KGQ49_06340 [Verrucomicrobia bacterium]|nr:hypothetical protein [Verrucomicrobiota bacterium]MBU6446999.1 hypothetical protein [Verrucomicrobiota bacterium]MDE3046883.1 hypothetical protein [Verrucomicrobiota bacterium]
MKWFVALLIFLSSCHSTNKAPNRIPAERIGVHTAKYHDAKRGRPVVVEVWYPTDRTGPIDQPEDPVWEHPQEIRDVALTEGIYPLIMMSHGHGGNRRDHSWIVEHLVKHGFIVASVEHYGNSWRNYNPALTLRFWERAKDITFAITAIEKDPLLKKHIDPKRVGFVGYSLGGMTGLVLGGAKMTNLKQIALEYVKKYTEIDKINQAIVESTDFTESQNNFGDRRIKAFALLSPATFAISPESLRKVKVPVALIASEEDEVLPHQEHALKIVENLKPARLKLFQKSSHYVFLNRVSDVGKELLRPNIHTETIQTDRTAIHEEVGHFLVQFFQEHLR